MVTIVKHEWHQVDAQFAFELEKDLLEEIYPDMDEDDLEELWQQVVNGEADIDEIVSDAWNNDVEIEWDRQYDDWWSDRKGGYDITYEYGDEDSWHTPPAPAEPTHKCTKCKWVGQSYETDWQWLEDDEEGKKEPKKTCPMCESDTELTEAGVKEENERKEREARWALVDDDDTNEEPDEEVLQQKLQELKDEFDKLMTEEEKKNESGT